MAHTEGHPDGRTATTARSARPVLLRFLEVVDDRVAPTELSKPTLTTLCHALEDQVLAEDLDGTIVAGFQQARYWATERPRYETLTADPRRQAIVFTADDDGVTSSVDQIVVGEEHDLAREWFVLALTSAFSAVVLGRELSRSRDIEEDERRFLTIWSFDPTVIGDLLDVLTVASEDLGSACPARLRAAAHAMPPRVPAPLMAQRFANAVFERLEARAGRSGAPTDGAPGAGRHAPERPDSDDESDDGSATDVVARSGHDDGRQAGPTWTRAPADRTAASGASPHRVVLIVDDEPGIRGLEEALLRRAGWRVHAVGTAEDARRAARDHPIDALLIDIGLAGGDDHDLIAELDGLRPGIAARTVIVAGDPATARVPPGLTVIRKPVVWAELRAALAPFAADD